MRDWLRLFRNSCKKTPNGMVLDWRRLEIWEDYPAPNENILHVYCQVSFPGSKKRYYYRTRNPVLQVGDWVYVPVGRGYKKTLGRIVTLQLHHGRRVPYPLEYTKYIMEKAEEDAVRRHFQKKLLRALQVRKETLEHLYRDAVPRKKEEKETVL